MRRNCNLELRLLPSSASLSSTADHSARRHHHHQMEGSRESVTEKQHQPLTIFYNGRVCVSDVTELQARAILLLASTEMEEKMKTPSGSEPTSPILLSPLYSPTVPTSLSMRRSLQRFLQKRKHRIQATSPYNH